MANEASPDNKQSETAPKRISLATICGKQLRQLAYKAQFDWNLKNHEVVIVCVQVFSEWLFVAEALYPNIDWQKYKGRRGELVLQAVAMFSICESIAARLPITVDELMKMPSIGTFKCLVLEEGECRMLEIEPRKPKRVN